MGVGLSTMLEFMRRRRSGRHSLKLVVATPNGQERFLGRGWIDIGFAAEQAGGRGDHWLVHWLEDPY